MYRTQDVLDLYARPHDPERPVVGFHEESKVLHGPVADPLPVAPGRPAKEDYEHTRHGTADLFVVEPWAGRRHLAPADPSTGRPTSRPG